MKIRVHFEIDLELPVESVWPDGQVPFYPKAEDVYILMHGKHTPPTNERALDVIREWNLCEGEELRVSIRYEK